MKNWPVNWAAVEGSSFTFSHNSLGLRGRELTLNDLSRNLIFVYGGSTTYDMTVTDGKTWPERLELDLNHEFTVVNFGMIGHSTTEHLIQTAFYQDSLPRKPVCSVYYVGWNDLWHAHLDNFDEAYIDYHGPLLAARKPYLLFARYSPALRLISVGLKARFDPIPPPRSVAGKKPVPGPDKRLERVFSEHVRTIAAINVSRGITPIFIGQIINREFYNLAPKDQNILGALIKNEDAWPVQAHLNMMLKRTALASGAKYIDAGIDNFHYEDFVDHGHFSAQGSSKFAKLIYKDIGEYCQPKEQS